MFLRATFLLTLTASLAVAAPTDEEVGRKIAIMEVGSKPAAVRDPLSVLTAPAKAPVLYPSLLPLMDDELASVKPLELDAGEGLINARWFHILGLGEQLKNDRMWAEVTTVSTTRGPVLPLRGK